MSVPLNNLTDTWNASGTTFTAIRMNVTNTASAAASKLLDLQVGGVSQFNVDPNGSITVPNTTVTVNDPPLNLAQTWNASGVVFTAILLNITNTASAAGSKLIDLQIAGVTQFNVDKAGAAFHAGALTANTTIATPIIGPTGPDGASSFKITKADLSTAIMTFDTSNRRIGINKAASLSNFDLDVNGAIISQSTVNALTAHVGPVIGPSSDSTTALKVTKSDLATAVMTFDTSNARVGINKTPGAFDLDVNGAGNFGTSITNPILIGGTAAGSSLTIRATSGVGVGAEFVDVMGGNNGAQRLGRFTNTINGQCSGLGIGTTTAPANGIQLQATSVNGIKGNIAIDRTTTAATVGTDLSLTAGAAVSGGTDIAGGNVIINGGIGTGAAGSNIQMYISPPATSGTGDNAVIQQLLLNSTGIRLMGSIAVPAGGTTGQGLKFSSTNQFGIFWGSGAPTLSAAQGSLYLNTTGSSTSTRLYVNTNGSTGWTNVVTAT